MDDWQYVERETVTNPKGHRWTIALMDVLGQQGDPDMPDRLMELQYSSGRYFTLVYSESDALQRERGYVSLEEAKNAYQELLMGVIDGSIDPSQPVFRENLED
jgi:putative sterol carrier protein